VISCLTVTRDVRFDALQLAIGDFVHQTHAPRELVIVHDGSGDFDTRLRRSLECYSAPSITVHHEPRLRTLGELRNVAVDLARGDFVCQWDDDDRHHPRRLAVQWAALQIEASDFCFLTDQLHLFAAERRMYWDDWSLETYPLNLIQGTLLGRKSKIGRYPALGRGEDTRVVLDLLRRGCKCSRIAGHGYLYVYIFDGNNAWDHAHHAAISAAKRYDASRLLAHQGELRARLAEYRPTLGALTMPYRGGELHFA
jgi:glycosyltransferase involved in cell wall biosynthesis